MSVIPKLSDWLEEEISLILGCDADSEGREEGDPPMTRNHAVKELMNDLEEFSVETSVIRKARKDLRQLGIQLGIYREITEEEMSRVYVSCGKKYDFKLNGKWYVFESWEGLEP
jgi:hypothetical protein